MSKKINRYLVQQEVIYTVWIDAKTKAEALDMAAKLDLCNFDDVDYGDTWADKIDEDGLMVVEDD